MNEYTESLNELKQDERRKSFLFWLIVAGICIAPIFNYMLQKHEEYEKERAYERQRTEQ